MKLENNLEKDDIQKLVWRLAVPSMLAQFVSVLYSIVDRMYIGSMERVGENALAGVGICGPVVTLISAFSMLFGIGGAPLMSIRLGQKNRKEASHIVANCFMGLTVLSAVLTVLVYVFRNRILMWFGASEITFPYAEAYLSVYLCGTVFALLSVGMNQFIVAQGFAKTGMKSVLLGAVLNIVLDPVFIFGLDMGVRGAALATVLSQIASCSYVLWFLFGKHALVRITFGNYSISMLKQIMLLGMTPATIIAFDNLIIIGMNIILQKYGGSGRGDMLLTCATIIQSFMLLITMPLGGITTGTQTILGYNFGAGKFDRVWKAEKNIALLCLLFTGSMFLIAHTVPEYFVRIFTRKEEYIALSVWGIKTYTWGILALGLQYTIVDGLTGMGLAKPAILLSMFRKIVFLSGICLIPLFMDVTGSFYAEPLSDFAGAALSVSFYLLTMKKILKK